MGEAKLTVFKLSLLSYSIKTPCKSVLSQSILELTYTDEL